MKEIKPTNETGKNPETEQEKEVLPSFFQTLKTSTSKPLPNREVLEYNICLLYTSALPTTERD